MALSIPSAVLFDLDGTLLDTAGDLAHACNTAAQAAGLATQPLEALRPYVSGGAEAMLAYVRSQDPRDVDGESLLEHMLSVYEAHIAVHTRFFEGMERVLGELERREMPWGIVTNKVSRFTDRLLDQLGLTERPGCVISGDTLDQKKPHPAPMLEACRRIDRKADDCVYVGDARRDIQAGQNAGMLTLAALYGYVSGDDPAEGWGADGALRHPTDLLHWLDTRHP